MIHLKKDEIYYIGKFKQGDGDYSIKPIGKPLVLTGLQLMENYQCSTFEDYMNLHAYKDFKLMDNIQICTKDKSSGELTSLATQTVLKPLSQNQQNPNQPIVINSPLQDAGGSAYHKEMHTEVKKSLQKQIDSLNEQLNAIAVMNEELRNKAFASEERAMKLDADYREMVAKNKAANERIKELTEHNKDLLDRLSNVNQYYDEKVQALQDESTANISGLLDNPMIQGLFGMATQIATPFIEGMAENVRLKREKAKLELEEMKRKLDPNYKSTAQNIPNSTNQAQEEQEFEMEI